MPQLINPNNTQQPSLFWPTFFAVLGITIKVLGLAGVFSLVEISNIIAGLSIALGTVVASFSFKSVYQNTTKTTDARIATSPYFLGCLILGAELGLAHYVWTTWGLPSLFLLVPAIMIGCYSIFYGGREIKQGKQVTLNSSRRETSPVIPANSLVNIPPNLSGIPKELKMLGVGDLRLPPQPPRLSSQNRRLESKRVRTFEPPVSTVSTPLARQEWRKVIASPSQQPIPAQQFLHNQSPGQPSSVQDSYSSSSITNSTFWRKIEGSPETFTLIAEPYTPYPALFSESKQKKKQETPALITESPVTESQNPFFEMQKEYSRKVFEDYQQAIEGSLQPIKDSLRQWESLQAEAKQNGGLETLVKKIITVFTLGVTAAEIQPVLLNNKQFIRGMLDTLKKEETPNDSVKNSIAQLNNYLEDGLKKITEEAKNAVRQKLATFAKYPISKSGDEANKLAKEIIQIWLDLTNETQNQNLEIVFDHLDQAKKCSSLGDHHINFLLKKEFWSAHEESIAGIKARLLPKTFIHEFKERVFSPQQLSAPDKFDDVISPVTIKNQAQHVGDVFFKGVVPSDAGSNFFQSLKDEINKYKSESSFHAVKFVDSILINIRGCLLIDKINPSKVATELNGITFTFDSEIKGLEEALTILNAKKDFEGLPQIITEKMMGVLALLKQHHVQFIRRSIESLGKPVVENKNKKIKLLTTSTQIVKKIEKAFTFGCAVEEIGSVFDSKIYNELFIKKIIMDLENIKINQGIIGKIEELQSYLTQKLSPNNISVEKLLKYVEESIQYVSSPTQGLRPAENSYAASLLTPRLISIEIVELMEHAPSKVSLENVKALIGPRLSDVYFLGGMFRSLEYSEKIYRFSRYSHSRYSTLTFQKIHNLKQYLGKVAEKIYLTSLLPQAVARWQDNPEINSNAKEIVHEMIDALAFGCSVDQVVLAVEKRSHNPIFLSDVLQALHIEQEMMPDYNTERDGKIEALYKQLKDILQKRVDTGIEDKEKTKKDQRFFSKENLMSMATSMTTKIQDFKKRGEDLLLQEHKETPAPLERIDWSKPLPWNFIKSIAECENNKKLARDLSALIRTNDDISSFKKSLLDTVWWGWGKLSFEKAMQICKDLADCRKKSEVEGELWNSIQLELKILKDIKRKGNYEAAKVLYRCCGNKGDNLLRAIYQGNRIDVDPFKGLCHCYFMICHGTNVNQKDVDEYIQRIKGEPEQIEVHSSSNFARGFG